MKAKAKRLVFPSIKSVARCLVETKTTINTEYPELDVRLQVTEDGGWGLHTGDSQYDQDHTGYWGYGYLTRRTNCYELAQELVSEAQDHWAQSQ